MNSLFPALIVFGILFAIALLGLVRSNAAAARLNGSFSPRVATTVPAPDPSRTFQPWRSRVDRTDAL